MDIADGQLSQVKDAATDCLRLINVLKLNTGIVSAPFASVTTESVRVEITIC